MPTPHLSLPRPAAAVADARRSSTACRPPGPRTTTYAATPAHVATCCRARSTSPRSPAAGRTRSCSRSGATVEAVLWCPGEQPYPALEATAAARGRPSTPCGPDLRAHPGPDPSRPRPRRPSLSVVRAAALAEVAAADRTATGLVLVADGIEYAGNLGTLIRTADACAVDALVLTRATARVTHPKAFVASRGTVLTTPVLEYADVAEARADLIGRRLHDVRRRPGRGDVVPRGGAGLRADRGGGRLGGRRRGRGVADRPHPGLDPDARPGRLAQRRRLRGRPALRGAGDPRPRMTPRADRGCPAAGA